MHRSPNAEDDRGLSGQGYILSIFTAAGGGGDDLHQHSFASSSGSFSYSRSWILERLPEINIPLESGSGASLHAKGEVSRTFTCPFGVCKHVLDRLPYESVYEGSENMNILEGLPTYLGI